MRTQKEVEDRLTTALFIKEDAVALRNLEWNKYVETKDKQYLTKHQFANDSLIAIEREIKVLHWVLELKNTKL
jgi:hypothetical protein